MSFMSTGKFTFEDKVVATGITALLACAQRHVYLGAMHAKNLQNLFISATDIKHKFIANSRTAT